MFYDGRWPNSTNRPGMMLGIRPAFVAEEESKSGKRKLVKLDFSADDAAGGGGTDAAQARNAAAAAAQLINERRAGAGFA